MTTQPLSTSALLEATEIRLLEGQQLWPRRTFSGRAHGERVSRKKGVSLEFAEYRDYTDGDDLRHLDWSILARLDRPTIRTYRDEDDLAVYVALDASQSMDFGEPTKFAHAAKLAAAMGFLGLIGHDTVTTLTLGASERGPGRALRGRGNMRLLTDWIGAQRPNGDRGLATSLTRFANSGKYRAGLFLCLSDGLDPNVFDALRSVAARGHEIVFVQILSEIEMDPDLEGDLRLLDAESGEIVEVTAHAQTLREYKNNLAAHCQTLEETVLKCGGRFLKSPVEQSLSEFVTRGLRRLELVR